MLNALRRAASSFVAKILLIILVVSFGIWGISGVFTGSTQQVVMQVGDARISAQAFRLAMQRELTLLSQRVGRQVSLEQARLFGFERQLIGKLATDVAIDARAEELGLGISDERLGERIAADPIFAQVGGYNPRTVRRLLAAYNITEADFIDDTRSLALRQQIARSVVGGMEAPQAMIEMGFRYLNETRTVSYIALPAIDPATLEAPSRETLESFFEENKEAYVTPERRSFTTLVLTPEALARAAEVSDSEIEATYQANIARYSSTERRDVTQILFQDEAKAREAHDRLLSGESIETIASDADLGAAVSAFGVVERGGIIDETVADAAFSMSQAGVSDVLDGRFGKILVVVNEIAPQDVQPLSEVADAIRQQIALTRADEEIFSLSETVEDARAGGESLEEIATRLDLPLETFTNLDETGKDEAGEDVSLPEADGLLSGVFESDIGVENNYLSLGERGFLWFEVTAIEASRQQALSDVEAAVIDRWLNEAAEKALVEKGDALAARLAAGETLATLAAEEGLAVELALGMTRESENEALGDVFIAAIFEGPVGYSGSVEGGEGTARLVFHVDDVAVPAFFMTSEDASVVSENFANALQDGLLTQMVSAIQDDLGVRINQPLIDQLTGASER